MENMAEALGETSLLRRVSGQDLYAKEAHFHESCYRSFYSRYQTKVQKYHQSKSEEPVKEQTQVSTSHMHAYLAVKKDIQKIVLSDLEVVLQSSENST